MKRHNHYLNKRRLTTSNKRSPTFTIKRKTSAPGPNSPDNYSQLYSFKKTTTKTKEKEPKFLIERTEALKKLRKKYPTMRN